MNEAFLHYIWKFKLFNLQHLATAEGEKIQVIRSGEHNTDEGPDFFNARIRIGNTLWAGNVEIHTKASDWKNHAHHGHHAYDNIILHVVFENDKEIKRKDGAIIPCLELKNRIDKKIFSGYERLMKSRDWIPCRKQIGKVDEFTLDNWTDRLVVERLERKTKEIEETLLQNRHNWEETFYRFLARNFGLKINAHPFEQLAKSLPLKVLAKHKSNLLQVEALLFGQAGLLDKNFKDEYPNQLKKEYGFLRKKYSLSPVTASSWKFLRLMPANFPTVRIAQFAQLVHRSSHLFSKIMEAKNVKEMEQLFEVATAGYWDTHYLFDKPSVKKTKHLGRTAVHALIINTIVPFLFIYGKSKGNDSLREKALGLLGHVPAEKNNIIKKWEALRIHSSSAYRTQALLQLKNNYCDNKQCLNCAIGNKLLMG